MLTSRLTNCPECTTIPSLLEDIECQITTMAIRLYNNVVFSLNQTINSNSIFDLLQYKRILQYKICNIEYAGCFTVEMIASRIKLLTTGCKNRCYASPVCSELIPYSDCTIAGIVVVLTHCDYNGGTIIIAPITTSTTTTSTSSSSTTSTTTTTSDTTTFNFNTDRALSFESTSVIYGGYPAIVHYDGTGGFADYNTMLIQCDNGNANGVAHGTIVWSKLGPSYNFSYYQDISYFKFTISGNEYGPYPYFISSSPIGSAPLVAGHWTGGQGSAPVNNMSALQFSYIDYNGDDHEVLFHTYQQGDSVIVKTSDPYP